MTIANQLNKADEIRDVKWFPKDAIAEYYGVSTPLDTSKNAAYTYTLAANSLGTKKLVRLRVIFRKVSGTNSVTFGCEIGGTTVFTAFASTNAFISMDITIAAANATSAQRATSFCTHGPSGGGTTTVINTSKALAKDTTADLAIIFYVTKTTGSDDVIPDHVEITVSQT